jgi:hypothetical protein
VGNISYQPIFQHTDWVDDVDQVRAAEPNGFNLRFRNIESDLLQVSTVVGKVAQRLGEISNRPRTQHRLTLPPAMVPLDGPAWDSGSNGGTVTGPAGGANGVMPLTLPDKIGLVSLRVIGQAQVPVTVSLFRAAIAAGAPVQLATLQGTTNPFDLTANVDPATAEVDLSSFLYFIRAATSGSGLPTRTALGAFQLTYLA